MMSIENWHTQNIDEVLSVLDSGSDGLTQEEAQRRLDLYGFNEFEIHKKPSLVLKFLSQFHNVLIYVLLVSAAITIILGHLVDTSVILGVVILNAIFGFIQEGKAEKAIDAIMNMLAPNASVVRGGEYLIVPARLVVNGDIVHIKSGDKVPADLRLINTKNLQIQEAILTGESNAVEKNSAIVEISAPLGDRFNMAYGGTTVTYGKGVGVVVATGLKSEIGKIGALLTSIQPLTTPLLKQMNIFGRWLTLGIIFLALATFLIGVLFWHHQGKDMFMAAVGLAVAAIPEGLPPVLTIILALGVTRMAKRNAIIRRLPAVETMGAITTICTDKTGTLTRNEQTVKNIITSETCYDVEENGNVVFSVDKKVIPIQEHRDLELAIKATILCNDGEFSRDSHDKWHVHGNPIDKACLELGGKVGIDLRLLQNEFPRADLIPYESEHKFMATLHHDHHAKNFIYIKGAPEQILTRCYREKINGDDREINFDYWYKNIEILARQGYRVIAIAYKGIVGAKNNLSFADVKEDLVLVGILGLIDAPRIEAAQAVEKCYAAGIDVKMITGDHALTAGTIANLVGINSKSGVLTGGDIDAMSDDELARAVNEINVYARTSPQHKMRLVDALQANGRLVAMTGDGVNDAPALRKANIGIAMGKKGAEIAKESADMVLADDNFATIVHAVEEGRVVYDNLKKLILFTLPTNMAEALTVVMAIIFGFMLPITPVQILWVNMVTSVALGVALGFEATESDVMKRPPRRANTKILSPFLIWRVIFVGLLFVACVFSLFIWERLIGVDLNVARTIAVNMLVMAESVYLINCRRLYGSSWNVETFFKSKPVWIAIGVTVFFQFLFTYLPFMQNFFGTAAIGLQQWFYISILMLFVFTLVEVEKMFFRKFLVKIQHWF